MIEHDAIVLAGGSARRLSGVDKPAQLVGGRTLLDRALEAVDGAGRVIVVGPWRPASRPARWVEEASTGGGPAPALAAGLPLVGAPVFVLLAADLPFAATAVPRLLAELARQDDADAVVLVDEGGRTQPLLAAYRTVAVRGAVEGYAGSLQGSSLHGLLSSVSTAELPAERDEAFDCDTPDDLARARRLATAPAVTGQR